MIIKQITSSETLAIRHKVMWPTKPISFVMLPNDENGKHYGLFLNDKLISVISIFIEDNIAQFRKFATLKEHQGKGYGSYLLEEIINLLKQEKINKLWCNARVEKTNFYKKYKLKCTEKKIKKEDIEYLIMERHFN